MTRVLTLMGTSVTIEVVDDPAQDDRARAVDAAIDGAFAWFRAVEACCSRFDPDSEARQLVTRIGEAVPASAMLVELVQFALALAADTNGAFDPTVGRAMVERGFARNYRTGDLMHPALSVEAVTYRDVEVDADRGTITVARPLVLDLGAVAKGMAVDLAALELQPFTNFAIDAGGDLYVGGHARSGRRWSVGIRHPRLLDQTLTTLHVTNAAVCTSGDYERSTPTSGRAPHILDPRAGVIATGVVSATVVAATAMVADGLATAAFVLGPDEGRRLLERHGVEGLIITSTLERVATQGLYSDHGIDEVLPHPEGAAHDHSRGARDPLGLG
jgi:FAD:protein FMN transferase